jgi:hypothetical protein
MAGVIGAAEEGVAAVLAEGGHVTRVLSLPAEASGCCEYLLEAECEASGTGRVGRWHHQTVSNTVA